MLKQHFESQQESLPQTVNKKPEISRPNIPQASPTYTTKAPVAKK